MVDVMGDDPALKFESVLAARGRQLVRLYSGQSLSWLSAQIVECRLALVQRQKADCEVSRTDEGIDTCQEHGNPNPGTVACASSCRVPRALSARHQQSASAPCRAMHRKPYSGCTAYSA